MRGGFLGVLGRWNEKDDLSFDFALGEVGLEFGDSAMVEGFEGFGELSCDADGLVRCEFGEEFLALSGVWHHSSP